VDRGLDNYKGQVQQKIVTLVSSQYLSVGFGSQCERSKHKECVYTGSGPM